MTRLIDADVFEKHLEDKWILHEISNKGLEQIGEWLAQEQTVDAIPIEWIENFIDNIGEHGREMTMRAVYRLLINEWRKEE